MSVGQYCLNNFETQTSIDEKVVRILLAILQKWAIFGLNQLNGVF